MIDQTTSPSDIDAKKGAAEREPNIRKKMYRGWLDLHWATGSGNRGHGQQEVCIKYTTTAGLANKPFPVNPRIS
jgi:hypothetical protein